MSDTPAPVEQEHVVHLIFAEDGKRLLGVGWSRRHDNQMLDFDYAGLGLAKEADPIKQVNFKFHNADFAHTLYTTVLATLRSEARRNAGPQVMMGAGGIGSLFEQLMGGGGPPAPESDEPVEPNETLELPPDENTDGPSEPGQQD